VGDMAKKRVAVCVNDSLNWLQVQVGLEPHIIVLASSWGSSSNVTLSPTLDSWVLCDVVHCAVVQNMNEQHVGHCDRILDFRLP
jgi:hypothetical protein